MRVVWKFDIAEAQERCTVVDGTPVLDFNFPVGSIVLDVQVQNDRPVFWVDLRDENQPHVQRFAVIGTGRHIPFFVDCWEGTWQEGPFVWHLYSVNEELYQLALSEVGS